MPDEGLASSNDTCVTYTPVANFTGPDTVCVVVCDAGGLCDSVLVPITVTPVNDAPVAVDDPVSTDEDTPVTVNVLSNDNDQDGSLLGDSVRVITNPKNGTVLDNGDSTLTYTPTANFTGLDSIQYEICDTSALGSLCDTALVVITINSVNDTPTIIQPPIMLPEDSMLTFCPTVSDPDTGDTLTVSICGMPDEGIASSNDTCVTYTPVANFTGSDTVCVVVCDAGGLCDSVLVPITVTPVNDAPVAVDDSETTDEDTPVVVDVQDNDSDEDGNPLTTSIIGTSTQGITPMVVNGDSISYTPPMNFVGMDTLTYRVCDTGSPTLCDTALVVITVNSVNDTPTIIQPPIVLPEDSMLTFCPTVSDPDTGDTLTVSICGMPDEGIASSNDTCVTYTPVANFTGQDTVCVVVCDAGGLCDSILVPITVTPVNDTPTIIQPPIVLPEDSMLTFCPTVSDPDTGDTLTVSICGMPDEGIASSNDTCVTYTPVANFTGSDTVCVVVCDAGGLCDSVLVPITVTPVNDAPVAVDDSETTDEDTPVVVDVQDNDSDEDGNPLTTSIIGTSTQGVTPTVVNGDSISYTPPMNFVGMDTLTYRVCDTGSPALCDTALVVITVNSVNDTPTIIQPPIVLPEDSMLTFCPTVSDPDTGDTLTVSICGMPDEGIASSNDTCVTYTPVANFTGPDTVCVVVCDAGGLCDSVLVPITVTPVNDAPVAVDDPVSTDEDTPVVVDVQDNDSDEDGNPLTTSIIGTSTQGVTPTVVNGDSISYTPPMNFVGMDTLTYRVCDTGSPALCDTAIVIVTVNAVNDTPTIVQPPISLPEDSMLTFCPTVSDPDTGDTLTVSICGMPDEGLASSNDTCVTYTPVANFTGSDTVCVVVCDAGGLCDSVLVPITVTPVNDAPVAVDDSETTDEDTPVVVDVQDNDSDEDGNPLTTSIIGTSTQGITPMVVNGDSISYTPPMNFVGMDTLTYRVCDTGSPTLCDTALVVITVNSVNDTPTIIQPPIVLPEDSMLTFCPTVSDPDTGDTLTVSICGMPDEGIASSNDTCVTYTPVANFTGQDTVCVVVCDAGGLCDSILVPITVTPVNDTPTIIQPPIVLPEDSMLTFCPTVSDPDTGDTLTVSICGMPDEGIASSNDTCVTYTPVANFTGSDTVCVVVCDAGGLCDSVLVPITVTPVNDAPVAVDDSETTDEDTPVVVDVQDNDSDEDGNPLTTSIIGTSTQGVTPTVVNGDSISYTPPMNFVGMDTLTYRVCDTGSPTLCDTALVVITVNSVNDTPTIIQPPIVLPEDSMLTFCPTVSDPDTGDTLTVSICGMPDEGIASSNDTCVTYTPVANFTGSDTVCVVVCDAGGLCDSVLVPITVTPVNDTPTIMQPPIVLPEDSMLTFCPTVSDPDTGDTLTVSICGMPNEGIASSNDTCVTYTPAANFTGPDTVCVVVCDAGGLCDSVLVPITVTPVNDAPVAVDDPVSTDEDTPVTVNVLSNDNDQDGSLLGDSVRVITNPKNGTVLDNGDSTLTYTPTANFTGLDSIQYEICDTSALGSLCDTALVVITINSVNDTPTIIQPPIMLPEDSMLTFCPTVSDPDTGDTLTVSICGMPDEGIASSNDTCVTYTPVANFTGSDTVCVVVCDAGGLCDSVLVPITVTPVNEILAIGDINNTIPNTPTMGNVLTNDSDPEGDSLKVSTLPITPPINGMLTLTPNGSYIYIPDSNFVGEDVFEYQVCDDGSPQACDTATVVIEVIDNSNPNNPPNGVEDNITTTVNDPAIGDLLSNDNDPDGDSLMITMTPITSPDSGILSMSPTGTYTYTPNPGFIGEDEFEYEVCDNGSPALCDTVKVTIETLPEPGMNTTFGTDDAGLGSEDMPITGNLLDNDNDPENDSQTATTMPIDTPMNGTITILPNGDYTYAPKANYNGPDQFSYRVCDAGMPMACDTAVVYLTVLSLNDPPLYGNESISTPTDSLLIDIDLDDNNTDPDGDILTVTPPAMSTQGGIVTNNGNGTIDYQPPMGYVGQDTVIYTVCDPSPTCVADTLFIKVGTCVKLVAHVWLEGAYEGNTMYTKLNDLGYLPGQKPSTFFGMATPAGQPYSAAPWQYMGTEGIQYDQDSTGTDDAGYPSTVVDWVLVSLRNGTDRATTVCTRAALLHSDGHIEMLAGFDCCNINTDSSYYLVIEHRNHLIVMSHQRVIITNDTLTYDFRSQQSYKSLLGFGQKQIKPGVFAMFAGNGQQITIGSADTDINVGDKDIWLDENGDHSSYYLNDFDLNGDVNVQDKNLWLNNNGRFSDVPRE